MKVFLEKEGKHLSMKFSGSAKALLKKLKINSEAVLVARNKELVELDERLKDTDEIDILSVVSGG